MKVCLLTRFFDFRNAGLGRFSQEILKGLKQRNFEVETISTNSTSLYSYFIYTAIQIPLKMPGCDVYHALTPMEGMHIPKDRSIVTFHDLIPFVYPERAGSGIGDSRIKLFVGGTYFKFASKIASRCRYIACNSQETMADVANYLGVKEDRIKVIRLGIQDDLEPGSKDNKLRFGYLGQLDRRKRIDLLIKEFKKSRADAELVIAGIGRDEATLKEIADEDTRVKFLGFIPDEELINFYNSLDYFIFPTSFEGYGLPIVEAMACKKPVVVLSDALIPHEVISRCEIVDNLSNFFNNPKHNCKLDENYNFAKEHSWDKCVEEYIQIYNRVDE